MKYQENISTQKKTSQTSQKPPPLTSRSTMDSIDLRMQVDQRRKRKGEAAGAFDLVLESVDREEPFADPEVPLNISKTAGVLVIYPQVVYMRSVSFPLECLRWKACHFQMTDLHQRSIQANSFPYRSPNLYKIKRQEKHLTVSFDH